MRWTTGLIAVVALAASADAFHVSAPGKARGIAGPQAARPLRAPGATKLAMGPSLWNEIAAAGTTALILLADDTETKTDRLYNGVPLTGNVEAPAWALPVFAVGVAGLLAIAVPLLLKPGTDAFNEQRNDIGVFSDKDQK